jgi:hypothetical protein
VGDTEYNLMWVKPSADRWCRLLDLDFGLIRTYGVYVIWDGRVPSRVVRVGHGLIASEFKACTEDPRVMAYLRDGPLFVTWAAADAFAAPRIHRYLEDRMRPLIADPVDEKVVAIAARLPF